MDELGKSLSNMQTKLEAANIEIFLLKRAKERLNGVIVQRESRIGELEEHNKEIKELEHKIVDLQMELQETNTFHTGYFYNKTTT